MDIDQEVEAGALVTSDSETAPKSTYDIVREAIDASGMEFPNDPIKPKDLGEGGNDRDDRGRFAKKDNSAGSDPKLVEPGQKEITAKDNSEGDTGQASIPAGAPAGWPEDAKTQWSQLSPAIQAAVLKREQEISEGGRRWSEEKRQFEETLTPLRSAAQRYGIDEREGLQRLIAANDFLERDPVGAIQYFAKQYGVDLQNLNQQPQRSQIDPTIAAIMHEVTTVKTALQTREQQEVEAEITRFRDNGHPHLDAVRTLMGHLLNSGQATDLEDAYQKATWATPEIREKLIAEQSGSGQANELIKERERTEKAKRSAVSLRGSPTPGNGPKPQQSFADGREATRAAMEQLGY